MNIKGKVVSIDETQKVTETFSKREFVIEYAENPQYPEFIKFELINDKCAILNDVRIGDSLDVHFNLKGRKWDDPKGSVKYFNSLQAWKIDKGQADIEDVNEPEYKEPNGEDDLPF